MRPRPLSRRVEISAAALLVRRRRNVGLGATSLITSSHRGRGAGGAIGRRGVEAERFEFAADGIAGRVLLRQFVGPRDLIESERLHADELVGEFLNAVGTG